MLPKRVLAARDASKGADDAFQAALDLTAVCGARLQVVSVATPPEPPTRVEGLRRRAADRGVPLETRGFVGRAAEQILRLAADAGADLIVVGHRGHSKIREWIFGSTSRRVVTHATCPVLVARAR